MGRADDEVEGKGAVGLLQNPDRLVDLVACRHHHKEVHVAVLVRLAVRVRAEQDYAVRMKLLGDLTGVFPDHGAGNQFAVFPPVAAHTGWPGNCHAVMLTEGEHPGNGTHRALAAGGEGEPCAMHRFLHFAASAARL